MTENLQILQISAPVGALGSKGRALNQKRLEKPSTGAFKAWFGWLVFLQLSG